VVSPKAIEYNCETRSLAEQGEKVLSPKAIEYNCETASLAELVYKSGRAVKAVKNNLCIVLKSKLAKVLHWILFRRLVPKRESCF